MTPNPYNPSRQLHCGLCGCVTVKAFLAQAKEEFSKKWDEAAQVSHTHDRLIYLIDILLCDVAEMQPEMCRCVELESELFSSNKPVSGL